MVLVGASMCTLYIHVHVHIYLCRLWTDLIFGIVTMYTRLEIIRTCSNGYVTVLTNHKGSYRMYSNWGECEQVPPVELNVPLVCIYMCMYMYMSIYIICPLFWSRWCPRATCMHRHIAGSITSVKIGYTT